MHKFTKCNIDNDYNDLISDIDHSKIWCSTKNQILNKAKTKSLAIKSGQSLTIAEQEDLINQLFACKETQTSPFNKNIITQISYEEIANKF